MPTSTADESAFVDAYSQYVNVVLKPAEAQVRAAFHEWRDEDYWKHFKLRSSETIPNPVQRVRVRIKRPESAIDKINRLPSKFPKGLSEDSLYGMRDMLGVRVVTFFQSHLKMVDTEIRTGDLLELYPDYLPRSYIPSAELDTIGIASADFQVRGRKPSGYASLHYVVRLAGEHPGPWFELQVRTMLEETWGEVEHQLAYKPDHPMDFAARDQFRIISEYLATTDAHFNMLYNHSLNRQTESEPVHSDQITTDNLPKVVLHFGYALAQREIGGLYDILALSQISTVGQLWDRGTLEVVRAIAATYEAEGKHADGFDVVATLCDLEPRPTVDHARDKALLHIRMTRETKQARQRPVSDQIDVDLDRRVTRDGEGGVVA